MTRRSEVSADSRSASSTITAAGSAPMAAWAGRPSSARVAGLAKRKRPAVSLT